MHISVFVVLVCMCSFVRVHAEHFIRLSAEGSYVHDFARPDVQMHEGDKMSLDEARSWIGAGWSEPISKSNGWSPAIGVGYRYMYKVLVIDAGFGAEYRVRNNQPYDIMNVKANHVDDTGEPFVGTHSWCNRHTTMQNVGIHIPVMVGFEVKRFYLLAGIKANIDLWGTTYEKGDYTMTGKYDRFMEEWEDISGHGLVTDEPYETKNVNKGMGWDLRACGEIGYCVYSGGKKAKGSSKVSPRYNVGAFVEYSVAGADKQYLPLLAGLRLTVLLPLPEEEKCNCLKY